MSEVRRGKMAEVLTGMKEQTEKDENSPTLTVVSAGSDTSSVGSEMSVMLMVVRDETHFVNTMEYVTGYVDVLLIKTMRMLTMLLS